MITFFSPQSFSRRIPLFPLPNAVLFPGIGIPLHIFEPRYRAMMDCALGGERLLGMVLLKDGWEDEYQGTPPIHQIGCLGEIDNEVRLPDGRWNFLLRGVSRFRIDSELQEDQPFRQAQVALLDEPTENDPDERTSTLSSQLLMSVWRHLGESDEARNLLGQVYSDNVPLATLADRLAAVLTLPTDSKQQVLEARHAQDRAEIILGALAAAFPGTSEVQPQSSGVH